MHYGLPVSNAATPGTGSIGEMQRCAKRRTPVASTRNLDGVRSSSRNAPRPRIVAGQRASANQCPAVRLFPAFANHHLEPTSISPMSLILRPTACRLPPSPSAPPPQQPAAVDEGDAVVVLLQDRLAQSARMPCLPALRHAMPPSPMPPPSRPRRPSTVAMHE